MHSIKLPGLVDVHVHLREPGATQKEDFDTGTKASIAGGYTQVLDMPNNNPPTTSPQELDNKINLATGKIYCDVGFNFGANGESTKYFQDISKKVMGLKVYMNQTTGDLLVDEEKERELIFKSWPGPQPIMVHAEGETVEVAIKLAKKYQKKLHVCHTTANQIDAIDQAKSEGLDISCEVTPHHLFLSQDDLADLGPFGLMKPPLLTKKEQQYLWDNLDKIDMIATDHAPHTIEEKNEDPPKFGVPGLETTLSLMLSALSDGRLTQERLIELTSTNPKKVFNLPAQKDTYIEVDDSKTYKISEKKLFTKCNWTPFKNLNGRGVVTKVILRGKTIYQDGNFLGTPKGQILKPSF